MQLHCRAANAVSAMMYVRLFHYNNIIITVHIWSVHGCQFSHVMNTSSCHPKGDSRGNESFKQPIRNGILLPGKLMVLGLHPQTTLAARLKDPLRRGHLQITSSSLQMKRSQLSVHFPVVLLRT